ncbi:MAG TPA: hypothetical protein VF331_14700 [Polyangiales bacterium]
MNRRSTPCQDARACVAAGEVPARIEEHLLACESCAAFALHSPPAATSLTSSELGSLLDALESRIDAERGVGAWLRTRPTWLRRVLALSCCALLSALAFVYGGASIALSSSRGLAAVAYGLLLVAVLDGLLRPIQPHVRASSQLVWSVSAVSVPVWFALLAATGPGVADPPARAGCLLLGLLVALLFLALLRLLDREQHAADDHAWLGVAAAGMLGNLALALYCPAGDTAHLLRWHAPVGLLLVAFYFGVRRIQRSLAAHAGS